MIKRISKAEIVRVAIVCMTFILIFCLSSCNFDEKNRDSFETEPMEVTEDVQQISSFLTDPETGTGSESITVSDASAYETAEFTETVKAVETETAEIIETAQTVETVTSAVSEKETLSEESSTIVRPEYEGSGVLTFDHLNELSKGRNIVFFLIDRFDVKYFEKLQQTEPELLNDLDGFTFYNDYTSLYCRTYPAISSILTGIENDFSGTRLNYFKKIYTDGGHLRALHEQGYDVNVYTQKYYAYDDASYMKEYVNNTAKTGQYDDDMKGVYDYITKNEITAVRSYGQFSFIHLYGCHTPVKYNLDWETANDKEKNDTTMALKQSLTIIYEYIEGMKRLGLYEDATIVITGDHPAAISDTKLIGQTGYSSDNGTRVTAMLFKRSGESEGKLKTSTAQISQDELWNTIYESEGLTSLKSGNSFFDISEGENRVRRYLFEMSVTLEDKSRADEIVEYKITGSARKAENWKIAKRTVIGKIYK